MQHVKITTLLLLIAGVAIAGTIADAVLNVGDTYKGAIQVADEDVVEFEGLSGERVTITAKADKKQSLLPHVMLADSDDNVLADEASGKKKSAIKKFELPSTGVYRIKLTGDDGTIGTYSIKTGGKTPKKITTAKNNSGVGPKETQDTTIDGKSGWIFSGTINSKKKSDAIPFMPTLTLEGGEEGMDPELLTGFIEKTKKGGFKIKDVVLPSLGPYKLSVGNSGMSGLINTSIKVKKPKGKGQTILEEK